jgi:hypothetical protein
LVRCIINVHEESHVSRRRLIRRFSWQKWQKAANIKEFCGSKTVTGCRLFRNGTRGSPDTVSAKLVHG